MSRSAVAARQHPEERCNIRVRRLVAVTVKVGRAAGLAAVPRDAREERVDVGVGRGVAIAVKAGAPKCDISTAEALKQTLLKAKSIAYSEPSAGGASGVYFAKLLERMGIAEQMKLKTKYPPPGGFSAELLLTGEAELAVQQKPELLHVSGVEIVGFLPGDLNLVTEFAAAIMGSSKNAAIGKALIESLRSPEAAAVFRSKGLDPR